MPQNATRRALAQQKLVRAVVEATADLSTKQLELNDARSFRLLLERLAARVLPQPTDPITLARFRGMLAMHELLSTEGGAVSAAQVAALLGLSRQAVDKRRKLGQLLAVDSPRRGFLYPTWQFTDTGSVLPGIEDVLRVLSTSGHDPWAQCRFLLSRNDRLAGKRPIDALRAGRIERVLAAAETFGEHGAA